MIDRLKRIFDAAVAETRAGGAAHTEHGRRLAVAALLMEMIRADHVMSPGERASVRRALLGVFELGREEVDQLMEAAEASAEEATSLYEFTSVVNQSFDHATKVTIVEMLWRVALSDGELEKHESHLVRRVSDLLHLRHREYIGAKLRAEQATGGG